MLTKLLASVLSKAQIGEFLGYSKKAKIPKEQLVAQLMAVIEVDSKEKERLLATFPYELAVGPTEVEELLQCTRVERRRWLQEGKLPVLEYRLFRKAGQELQYPVHDRRVILAITQDQLLTWREEYQAQVQEHRKLGTQIAIERRKTNQYIRAQFLSLWQENVKTWTIRGSLEVAVVLQLAFWTVWASRWAKENHLKALHSTKHTVRYQAQRDAWYKRKNEAMYVLYHTPLATLSFYRPEHPDKMTLQLCEEHYEEKIEGFYDDKWDFYDVHKAAIKACPQCFVHVEKDYYALYFLEIRTTGIPDVHFSFHMPYPIGRAFFPGPKKLPQVHHVEQDALFRFGRTLLPLEKITHRERDTLIFFEQALQEAKQLYPIELVREHMQDVDTQGSQHEDGC